MIRSSLIIVIAILGTAEAAETPTSDPFDLSSISRQAEELGVPTKSEVDSLESRAGVLFESGDCQAALPALEDLAKKSNFLANLVFAGIQPYYGASYDYRKNYSGSSKQSLVEYERLANQYKNKRNRATVMQGECFAKLGDIVMAAIYLSKALDFIDIHDGYWWKRARKQLYGLLEVE